MVPAAVASPMTPAPIPGAPEVRVVDHPEALGCIHQDGVALVIWRRSVPDELVRLLDSLSFAELPHLRVEEIAVDAVTDALDRALGPRAPALAPLILDVGALARRYAQIARLARIRLRLEAIRDDACRRFHADQVRLRLLCTYRGPGTEWIPRAAVRLAEDGYVADPDPAQIRRLERFAVGLFAGARAPLPCIHRSPPLAATGGDRLLLVIDEGAGAA